MGGEEGGRRGGGGAFVYIVINTLLLIKDLAAYYSSFASILLSALSLAKATADAEKRQGIESKSDIDSLN